MNMLQLIRESNLVEGIDSRKADAQSLKAGYFLEEKTGLNVHTICELQRMITETQDTLTHEQRGRWRTVMVRVGNYVPPAPGLIAGLMDNWLLDHWAHDAKTMHIRFERIHPFFDGNGRIGRMLMWWQEIKFGQEPTLIRASEREEYYKWFKGGTL